MPPAARQARHENGTARRNGDRPAEQDRLAKTDRPAKQDRPAKKGGPANRGAPVKRGQGAGSAGCGATRGSWDARRCSQSSARRS
ncbi:hypothetical protein GCM10010206_55860 [Streptomyces cinerochromogenes]|nr:hypothetical protein GCM10010206_55860 [Streptomyces cinerochromogenes]